MQDGYLLPQLCWFSVPTAESVGGDVNGKLHTLQVFLNIAHKGPDDRYGDSDKRTAVTRADCWNVGETSAAERSACLRV